MRVGIGYDVHRLVEGRKLYLGGVLIPYEKGLLGHSDADVLLHAVCDALLGAASLGDIGRHFPDTDPAYKNIDSKILLEKTYDMVKKEGFSLGNTDVTVFAEKPRLAPYIDSIIEKIASVMKVDKGRINVKATTTEGLGMIGAGEGISAMSVVILEKA